MGGGQGKDGEPNKPKYRKWTPESTGTIDRDKYNRTVIGPYDQNTYIYCVYGAAEEKAKRLAAGEAADEAALAAIKPRRSLDRQPTRTESNQSSV